MAVAKKSPKKTVVKSAAKKAAEATPATKPLKAAKKAAAKSATGVVAKKAAATAPSAAPAKAAALKPVKTGFTKTGLIKHLAEQANVEPKVAKAFMAALEDTILGSVHKRGAGEFTLPGLLKLSTQKVPARKKGIRKDPFTGVEREFPAKPASVRVKVRALKKLKDAAL